MIGRRLLLNKTKDQPLSIKDFCKKRNNVLIYRNSRGIGDILTHRFLFEDFKKLNPDIKLTFACFEEYHTLVKDHPFVDEVVNSKNVRKNDFLVFYDTTKCSEYYESFVMEKNTKNRAEIWADYCGIKLTNPNMHLSLMPEEFVRFANMRIDALNPEKKPVVLFCPIAFEPLRTLKDFQIAATVKHLKEKDFFVFSTHLQPIPQLANEVPVLTGLTMIEWLSFIHVADYVISVDTGTFHYAGGIKKPLVGIFTHIDGKTRGKFYDFVLVQKHRDNGDWPCGPCYNYLYCSNPRCTTPGTMLEKPCLTELTANEIITGIEKMLLKWPVKR